MEDTAVCVIKFKSGAFGQITASTSLNPALFTKVMVYGSNGATISIRTENDSTPSAILQKGKEIDSPLNDIWTVPDEELEYQKWLSDDRTLISKLENPGEYFIGLQITDFIGAVQHNRTPLVNGEDARKVVAQFNAIYRSSSERKPISLL